MLLMLPLAREVAGQERPRPVSISLWAVHALQEEHDEKRYDRGLEAVQDLLRGLPYNTFRQVQIVQRRPAPYNEQTRLRINEQYTVVVRPLRQNEDGSFRLELVVEMPPKADDPDKEPVKAVSATVNLPAGEKLAVQAPMDKGELIIIISAT